MPGVHDIAQAPSLAANYNAQLVHASGRSYPDEQRPLHPVTSICFPQRSPYPQQDILHDATYLATSPLQAHAMAAHAAYATPAATHSRLQPEQGHGPEYAGMAPSGNLGPASARGVRTAQMHAEDLHCDDGPDARYPPSNGNQVIISDSHLGPL